RDWSSDVCSSDLPEIDPDTSRDHHDRKREEDREIKLPRHDRHNSPKLIQDRRIDPDGDTAESVVIQSSPTWHERSGEDAVSKCLRQAQVLAQVVSIGNAEGQKRQRDHQGSRDDHTDPESVRGTPLIKNLRY